jgi:hypothetical protein
VHLIGVHLTGVYLMGVDLIACVFGGRWPGVTFLIFALSGNLALGPIAPGSTLYEKKYIWPNTLVEITWP